MNRFQHIIKNKETGEVLFHTSYSVEYSIGDAVLSAPNWEVIAMGVTSSFKERFQALMDDEMNSFLEENSIVDENITPTMQWKMTDAIETLLNTIAEFKLAWLGGNTDEEQEAQS